MNRCSYLTRAGKLEFKIAVLRMRHLCAERKEKQAWEDLEYVLHELDFLKARMEKERGDG